MMKESSKPSQPASASPRAFQLKGSLITLTVLELLKPEIAGIAAQLAGLLKQTPDLFRRMPVIIDLSKTQGVKNIADLQEIHALLREHGLIPVGFRGGSGEQQALLETAGLPVFTQQAKNASPNFQAPNANADHKSDANAEQAEQSAAAAAEKTSAKLITQPVRSGQQIYAKNGDLIILSSVSPGAEILADGNIHIYGSLRGRALAGINGNKAARIFCKQLEAELVSIAGHYWLNEDLSPLPEGQTIQVYLENDRLHIGAF